MIFQSRERGRQDAAANGVFPGNWQQHDVRSPSEVGAVINAVLGPMEAAGYSSKDVFGMRLVLEEAVVNGLKHGNQFDPVKRVRVRCQVNAERAVVEVEDEGPGFDPREVPDPLDPENLERPCGRGLLLMRSYTTWMRFNERGNCVTVCKERS
jgi:serine/threonine-protein kinase RsbW